MSTGFAIKCFVSDCNDPVIGQCTGYGASCGRFYCEAHSHNGLCVECAERAAQDQVLEDYFQTAENVDRQLLWSRVKQVLWYFASVGGLFLAAQLMFSLFGSDSLAGGLLICAIYPTAAIFIVMSWLKRRGQQKHIVAEIEAVKPEFTAFYKAYKRDKNIRLLKSAAIFTVGAAVAMVTEDLRRSAEEARIQTAVDEGFRRHGF